MAKKDDDKDDKKLAKPDSLAYRVHYVQNQRKRRKKAEQE